MTTWTSDELTRIGAADELEIAPQRGDGTLREGVTIWVVRVGDDLYVRSWRGHAGAWFRAAQARRAGHIRAGGVEKDVRFVEEPTQESTTRSTPRTAPSTTATPATCHQ